MKKRKDQAMQNGTNAPPGKSFGADAGGAADATPGSRSRAFTLLSVAVVLGCAFLLGAFFLNLFPAGAGPATAAGNLTVYYFYGTECPHCHNVTPYIGSLRDKYPDVEFRILETWHDTTNQALLNLLSHRAGRGEREATAVPQVIFINTSLLGGDEIAEKLEPMILAKRGNLTGSSTLGAVPVLGPIVPANATITATYFYGNGCSHCEAVKPVIANISARYPELRIEALEINDNRTNLDAFLGMPLTEGSGDRAIPALFIGSRALFGEAAVKDHLEETVYAEQQRLAAAAPVTTIAAAATAAPAPAGSDGRINAVFFYSDSCVHCEKVKPVIANISARYPELNFSSLEVTHSAQNRDLFSRMCSSSGIVNPGVPTVFIGKDCLVGEAQIRDQLEASVISEEQRIAAGRTITPTPANNGTAPQAAGLSPLMVIGAALVDSMNPCGLSVLVFLLLTMAAAFDRRRILLVGGTYIVAMFLFHLLVGIGLFSAFSLSGLAKPFSILGGLVALVLGIMTLVDVLRNRETYLLSIPQSGKGMLGDYARRATLPAAFVLGVLAGILGFSCTGGIYISILGLMGREMNVMAGLPWLVLYNIVFVLPLVLVTLLVAFGISPDRAEKWRTENKRAVRVVIGLILVALGITILAGWMG